MSEPAAVDRPSMAVKLFFATGSLGTGIFLTVPSVLLLYYLTDVLGLEPALAGLAVFLPRAYDVLLDPVMGWISDRTRSRIGRRRPYLLAGALLLAVTFVFLFNAPQLDGERALFAYVVIVYALSATAYTVFAVPYLAMPSEMSPVPEVRTEVMAWRMAFAVSGILIGSSLAPWLVAEFGGGRAGFARMSWVVGLFCAAAMLVAFFGTRRAPVTDATVPTESVRSALRNLVRNRPFSRLACAYAIQLAGLGSFNAVVPYFVVYVMRRDESAIGILLGALLGCSVLSMPLWTLIARRTGKFVAYRAAAVCIVLGTIGMWFASAPEAWAVAIAFGCLLGVGFGGAQLLPFSMLSDVICSTASTAAGTYTGAWTAIEKAGLAVGPLLVGIALQITGFVEGLGPESQTADALQGVLFSMSALPAVLVALSLPIIRQADRRP